MREGRENERIREVVREEGRNRERDREREREIEIERQRQTDRDRDRDRGDTALKFVLNVSTIIVRFPSVH